MLDKIVSMIILPFYGLWKYLLNKKSPVNKKIFQIFLLNIELGCMFVPLLLIFIDVPYFELKILLAFPTLICFVVFIFNTVKTSVYQEMKANWISNRMLVYSKKIILVLIIFFLAILTEYKLLTTILLVVYLTDIMFFVGFEFPDEPPNHQKGKARKRSSLYPAG